MRSPWAITCVVYFSSIGFASAQLIPTPRAEPSRIPVLIDSDLGTDIGDAFALGLLLASPELDGRGITTVSGDTNVRALMACRFMTMAGRRQVAVSAGAAPQPKQEIVPTGQYRYYYHPDVLFNRTTRPVADTAADFLFARFKEQPGKLTLIAAGPLTNIAQLLARKPEVKPWIKQLIVAAENFPADPAAARSVLAAELPLVVIPTDVSAALSLSDQDVRRIFRPATALTMQVEALHQLWDGHQPRITDAIAIGLILKQPDVRTEKGQVAIDDRGELQRGAGHPAEVVSLASVEQFRRWFVGRWEQSIPPAAKPASPVPRGKFPARIHVAEDFETEIQRFWWMAGKPELKNLPPASARACRGTLTHDYDDLLGNAKAMHTAVIFNPVPGPPMGANTRLSFQYWLKGTSTLRVQIYSLSNGYHRQLYLRDLPQESWQECTVDLTQARRPDGTGGPLSRGERIDDIQFYVEPTAEVLIDNISLYDAAADGEARPFPRRVLFTGWFDSGKQGKEWPGDLEIVDDGLFWRGAKSVKRDDGQAWLRVDLRGDLVLGATTHFAVRARSSGSGRVRVELSPREGNPVATAEFTPAQGGEWKEFVLPFPAARAGVRVRELRFFPAEGEELTIDDLVLYEP